MRLRAGRPAALRRDRPNRKGAFELWKALPRARPYMRPYRKMLGLSMVAMVIAAVFALAEPWPLALVLNSALGDKEPPAIIQFFLGKNPGLATLLIFLVVARFAIVAVGHAFIAARNYLDAKAEQHMVLDLRSDLFDHAQKLSLTFHDRRQTGQLMSQINNQAAALGNIIMAFPPIIESLLMLGGMITIAWLIDWQVTLAGLSVIPLLYLSFVLYGRMIVPRLQRVQELEWRSLSIVHEAMSMLRVIVSFGRERYEHRKFREQGEVAVDERVKLTFGQSLYTLGVQSATALGTSIVIGFAAWHVAHGVMPVGGLIVLMSYFASIYQPLEQISATVGSLHEQFVQFNASLRLLEIEPEVRDAPDAVTVDRVRGDVTIDKVGFAYHGRKDTLRDISLVARAGESVAIVGQTGAGKTTLMSLMIRFYDPQQGSIQIDGIDIRRLGLRSLREQISVVLQEPMLFSGTIAENIRYGKLDASMDEVMDATRAANAHDFIMHLPDGYETVLGERGAQLSGGERQRICVARAFLKDAPILILDEPTSSIDSKTEGVILDALDDLMVGRTSFMVAHRLSTVRHADQIVVLHQGRIVEVGTHEELVDLRGFYHQLHEAQSRERRRRRATARRRGNGLPEPPASPARAREAHEPPETPAGFAGHVEPLEDTVAAAGSATDVEPEQASVGSGTVAWREVRPPAPPRRIDINRAGVDELMLLTGVGRRAATRIVAYREANGPFLSVLDLARVKGFDRDRVRGLWEEAKV